MGSRPVKLVNGIYRQPLSKPSRRRSMRPQPVLKEKELELVSNSSDSLKRYRKKPQSTERLDTRGTKC